jgi:hypothetical protein
VEEAVEVVRNHVGGTSAVAGRHGADHPGFGLGVEWTPYGDVDGGEDMWTGRRSASSRVARDARPTADTRDDDGRRFGAARTEGARASDCARSSQPLERPGKANDPEPYDPKST